MKTVSEIEALEKVTGQLQGLHREVSLLAKKSPIDALNQFKLRLTNNVISIANGVLGNNYRPFDDFEQFDPDSVPSTSDVAMLLGQYIEEAERFRSDHIKQYGSGWYYVVDGEISDIRTGPPTKVTKK